MATEVLPKITSKNNTADVLSLIQQLTGTKSKTTTSGGSQTTQTQVTPEAMTELIRQMLSSNSGLASVAGGQKAAGLYNSSTGTQLMNDLLTKVSGQAALASAPTTVTKTPETRTTQTPGVLGSNVNPLLALVAKPLLTKGAGAISDIFSEVTKKKGTDLLTSGLGSFGATDLGSSGFLSEGSNILSSGANILGSGGAGISDFGNFSNIFSSVGDSFNFNPVTAGVNLGINALDNILGNTVNTGAGVFADTIASGNIDSGTSSILGGGLVGAASSAISSIGKFLGGGSVICTHMHNSGYLSDDLYTAEVAYRFSVNHRIYTGYRMWADPFVTYLKKSPKATKLLAPLVVAFAQETAHQMKLESKGSLLGKVLKSIGEPICYILSFFSMKEKSHGYA